ncbi:MAG: DUF6502 family protein [Gammaproteobacteria bacterium]
MEADLKAALLAAYARLLRPLVQILLRNGVSYTEFADTAKRVFVVTAAQGYSDTTATVPIAQLAIRTGLSQREVGDVLAAADHVTVDSTLTHMAALLGGWHTDVEFTGPYGLPLELPFEHSDRPSFQKLVHRYCLGGEPAQLLRRMLAVGAVKQAEDGWLTVLTRAYLPSAENIDSVERIGQAVARLVDTVDFNRQERDPASRLFERTVVADYGLKQEDLPALSSFIQARGQRLLEEIDNWISGRDRPEPERNDVVVHTGLGIYHYVDDLDKN